MSRFSFLTRSTASMMLATAVLFAAPTAMAEETIAVVNMQELMNKSTAANGLKEQMKIELKKLQAQSKEISTTLGKEEENLVKQRSVMAPEAFQEKVKDFRQRMNNAQRDLQERSAKLNKAFSGAFNDIQKAAVDIVAEEAKSKGYKAVISTQAAVYYDGSLDTTNVIMSKLNDKLPKASLKL
jgi:outer membrane protein